MAREKEHFEMMTPLSDAAVAAGWDVYNHYRSADPASQYMMAVEECGELVQAITKVGRVAKDAEKSRLAREHLAEEIADMRIMLAQLTVLLDGDEAVASQAARKLDRQRKRIAGEVGLVSGY